MTENQDELLKELYKTRLKNPIGLAKHIDGLISLNGYTYERIKRVLGIHSKATSIQVCRQFVYIPTEIQQEVTDKQMKFTTLSTLLKLKEYKDWRNDPTDIKKEIYLECMRDIWAKNKDVPKRELEKLIEQKNNKQKESIVRHISVTSNVVKSKIKKIRENLRLSFSWDETLTTQGNAERFLELLKAHMMVHELQYNNKAQVNNARLRFNLRKRLVRELPKNAKYCICGCKYNLNKVKELLAKDEKILKDERVCEEKAGIKRDSISEYVADFSALLHKYKTRSSDIP